MRNIAEIIEDDRKGKQLSQTERQIAVAYTQGKYDAVKELKVGNNSNTNEVLDKIRAEIADIYCGQYCENPPTADTVREMALEIIDKYKAETDKEEDNTRPYYANEWN